MVFGIKLFLPILFLWGLLYLPMRAIFRGVGSSEQFHKFYLAILVCAVPNFIAIRVELFFVLMAFAVWIAQSLLGSDTRAKITVYWMSVILFVPIHLEVGGVGGINYFLSLDHFNVAALVLLIPAALTLAASKTKPLRGTLLLDLAVLSYPLFNIALTAPGVSVTGTVRSLVVMGLGVVLPYFVLTRGMRSWSDYKYMLVRFVAACLFAAAVGLLEFAIQRNIYADLQWAFGAKWSLTHTLMRGNLIRVQAMTSQPILFAAQLMMTLGLWWAVVRANTGRRSLSLLVDFSLVAVLVFTFSRGPWLGALVFAVTLLALSRLKPRLVAVGIVVAACAIVAIKAEGYDETIMTALKAIFGSTQEDAGSIEYRNRLLDTAIALVRQSPWLGVPNYAAQMQDLVQGEGIIDLVNTYVGVSLNSGLVGLALYLLPFVVSLAMIFRRLSAGSPRYSAEELRTARAVAALQVGFLLTIFTTSSFERLPYLMMFLIALPAIAIAEPPRSVAHEASPGDAQFGYGGQVSAT